MKSEIINLDPNDYASTLMPMSRIKFLTFK